MLQGIAHEVGYGMRAHFPHEAPAMPRARQQTKEFKMLYRLRGAVERKHAEWVEHGLRATRYLGRSVG